jgi:DNA-binding response OmpR family regulator
MGMANEVSQSPRERPGIASRLRAKVAVLDDDDSFRALARAILEPAGFDVIEASDVPQCLRQLHSQSVDAVIVDMVMPGRDGFEALRDFRARWPNLRIVAVSGASDAELYLIESAHLGADASLEKSKIGVLCPLLHVVLDR